MPKRKQTKKQQRYVKKVIDSGHLASFLAVAKQSDIDDYFRTGWTRKEK